MSHISSLRILILDITLKDNFMWAGDCLKDLSKLHCDSYISPEFFYQLSQISHHIQELYISFMSVISNGLADLISAQKNLKYLCISQYCGYVNTTTFLEKIPNTLINLSIYGGSRQRIPLSFIAKLTNLQELSLSVRNASSFEDFKKFQYITFSQL